MNSTEGHIPFGSYHTWYRVTGDLNSGKVPLIALHGGPGCTHDYIDSLRDLADTGRAVIHYDQLGNGRSTHLPEKGANFWTVSLFVDELENLIDHLGVRDSYSMLGQSWGGMLGAEFAVRQPSGLKALIIANSPASMELWVSEANRLREELPGDVQKTLSDHENAGTTGAAEYEQAVEVFYERHVCRIVPMPDEVARTFAAINADPTVYHIMNGPSEFHVIGTLRSWSVIDRLDSVKVPTLLLSGRYDEATPAVVQPYADGIANVSWHIFDQSSHMPHVEQRAEFMSTVGLFLDEAGA